MKKDADIFCFVRIFSYFWRVSGIFPSVPEYLTGFWPVSLSCAQASEYAFRASSRAPVAPLFVPRPGSTI